MTNTVLFLAILASFIGYFFWKGANHNKNRRVWRIVEDTRLTEQIIKDSLEKVGAKDFFDDKEDEGVFFTYHNERYWLLYPELPAVNLSVCYVMGEDFDWETCERAITAFNDKINGVKALGNKETRQIAFATFSISPSRHIFEVILPYLSLTLKQAWQLFLEEYRTQSDQNKSKTIEL